MVRQLLANYSPSTIGNPGGLQIEVFGELRQRPLANSHPVWRPGPWTAAARANECRGAPVPRAERQEGGKCAVSKNGFARRPMGSWAGGVGVGVGAGMGADGDHRCMMITKKNQQTENEINRLLNARPKN